jgi:hypothetical protein
MLEAKRASWKNFVEEITHKTPSSTVWKKFKAVEGKSYEKIQYMCNNNNEVITECKDIAILFNNKYVKKSGHKVSWPKLLTKEEQFLTCNFEHICLAKDNLDVEINQTELEAAMDILKHLEKTKYTTACLEMHQKYL